MKAFSGIYSNFKYKKKVLSAKHTRNKCLYLRLGTSFLGSSKASNHPQTMHILLEPLETLSHRPPLPNRYQVVRVMCDLTLIPDYV